MDLNRLSDLKKKIFFTIFILLIYRVGTFVPIPGVDSDVVKTSSKALLEMSLV